MGIEAVKKQNKGIKRLSQTSNLMGLRWSVMGPLCPGLPCTSRRVYTPRVYYNHLLKQKQNISFELVAKEKPAVPSLSQRETPSDRLSHTAAESNNRLAEGEKLNRR